MTEIDYEPISDYAIIGDCRTAALVSKSGAVAWLCVPRFDGESVFNSLLDRWRGGSFRIAPVERYSVERRYLDGSAVLQTDFTTAAGKTRITDFMPAIEEASRRRALLPACGIVRVVEGLEGVVKLRASYRPRPRDGKLVPELERRGRSGLACDLGDCLLHLESDLMLQASGGEAESEFTIAAGQRRRAWLTFAEQAPAALPVLERADEVLRLTRSYWARWAGRSRYDGPCAKEVARSLVTLKLLSYAPSGSIVAAPTTSLPEELGGRRNWDYRFCWLRDAALTARVFFRLGYAQEASAFVHWLMHSTSMTHPALKVFYDLFGRPSWHERTVDYLEGYRGSRPVRAGNLAQSQFQLDVYGEVIESVAAYIDAGGAADKDLRRLLQGIGDLLSRDWSYPDHGIWEARTDRRHYVHSKAMCWLGLKHLITLAPRLGLRSDVGSWRRAKDAIHAAVLRDGYSPRRRSFVQSFGSDALDASVLMLSLCGFLPGDDPRILSTIGAVRRELAQGELVFRYRGPDGIAGKDGAFLICSFWLVEALARAGRASEAQRLFERLQGRANDVGLFSEEIDPSTGEFLGNFPQGLSHIGHVIAAMELQSIKGAEHRPVGQVREDGRRRGLAAVVQR